MGGGREGGEEADEVLLPGGGERGVLRGMGWGGESREEEEGEGFPRFSCSPPGDSVERGAGDNGLFVTRRRRRGQCVPLSL